MGCGASGGIRLSPLPVDARWAKENDVSAVKDWLRSGGNINAKDDEGWTLAHAACFYGAADVLRFVVSQGIDVNAVDVTTRTALHYAVQEASTECASILLNHPSTNLKIKNRDGMTALDKAVYYKRKGIVDQFYRHELWQSMTPLLVGLSNPTFGSDSPLHTVLASDPLFDPQILVCLTYYLSTDTEIRWYRRHSVDLMFQNKSPLECGILNELAEAARRSLEE